MAGVFDMESRGRKVESEADGDEQPQIEQVALTVDTTDDPTLPVLTFRMWTIGLLSCVVLSFLNQFFVYRSQPLIISSISAQIIALPLGRFMAAVLPTTVYRLPFGMSFTLNPGPFNTKEHVLITIFANSGYAFTNGNAYAVMIVDIIKVFYRKNIPFVAAVILIITTQVLGYGWAGLFRKFLVEPASMWWPGNLVQVSLFRAMHEKEEGKGMTRLKFFILVFIASFCYYILPGYLFVALTSLSWICWVFPQSVLAQQIGSGQSGLGVGAFALDWATTSAFLQSPLVTPFFAIANVFVGYMFIVYVLVPIGYWNNLYDAKKFPIYSSHLFTVNGTKYDIHKVVNKNFELDTGAYEQEGQLRLSVFFALTYGIGFATVASTLSHVLLFHGKEIWRSSRVALKERGDIHSKLMKRYKRVPEWWFLILAAITLAVSIVLCVQYRSSIQLPWWGVLLACAIASTFTLPIGVITATTNLEPGLNIITEYIVGYMLPGKPIANVVFKTYGYISMTQALAFLQDFKLGHYMKIPPRSMFVVQVVGTILAATSNLAVAWYMLNNIPNICDTNKLPESSPWTCPTDRVFFDASVIWGLVGPKRIFGSQGHYKALTWCFLVGALAPFPVWLLTKLLPKVGWLKKIHVPVMLGATAMMPPASSINYNTWLLVGFIFNYVVFKYRKNWWRRYNYVLSAGLDAGVAFMAVLIYLTLGLDNRTLDWWGSTADHCPLAHCPTAKDVTVDKDGGCPTFH